MNIMERNLPVAESLGEGDKVRIVTGGGNSKSIDADAFGCGFVLVRMTYVDDNTFTSDKTHSEISALLESGVPVIATWNSKIGDNIVACGSTHLNVYMGTMVLKIDDNTSYACHSGNTFTKN